MTDLNSLLGKAAGHQPAATDVDADVDADVTRGRRALRARRRTVLGRGAFGVALVAGIVAAQSGGLFDGSDTRNAPATAAPSMAFVAYTGEQPEGFTVATVPSGWEVQGVDEYALVIAPAGMKDTSLQSFVGKLVVMLESVDATDTPTGTTIAVGDRSGVVTKPGDGYGILHWTDAAGHRMVVQWPLDTGWTDREVADFAAGVKALSAAKAGRG